VGNSAVGNNFAKNSSSSNNSKILNYRLRHHRRRRLAIDFETTQETAVAVVGATQLNVCALSFRGSLI